MSQSLNTNLEELADEAPGSYVPDDHDLGDRIPYKLKKSDISSEIKSSTQKRNPISDQCESYFTENVPNDYELFMELKKPDYPKQLTLWKQP